MMYQSFEPRQHKTNSYSAVSNANKKKTFLVLITCFICKNCCGVLIKFYSFFFSQLFWLKSKKIIVKQKRQKGGEKKESERNAKNKKKKSFICM